MKIVELFNSIDGEGKRTGELTTFIRTFGCNLDCSYCDSLYACKVEGSELPYTEMSIKEIVDKCKEYRENNNTNNITFTGGEPLIAPDAPYLLQALCEEGFDVNVETNGAVDISKYFNKDTGKVLDKYNKNLWFTVDYKCPTSGMKDRMILDNFDVHTHTYHNVVYKFVVGSEYDLIEAEKIIKGYILVNQRGIEPYNNLIYISPVFGQIEPKEIVQFMQNHKLYDKYTPIRVQLQLHKFIWSPDMKGV